MALQSERVREGYEAVQRGLKEARDEVERRLDALEAQLWQFVQEGQARAQKASRQARRAGEARRHYATLGLKPGARLDEVKAAWRAQMRANHPDRFACDQDPAAEAAAHARAQALNLAYQELTALLTGRESRRG